MKKKLPRTSENKFDINFWETKNLERHQFLSELYNKHSEIVEGPLFSSDSCLEKNVAKLKKQTVCSVVHLTEKCVQKNVLKYSYLQKGKKKGIVQNDEKNQILNFKEISVHFGKR